MHKVDSSVKEKAISLRKSGLSYNQISEKLGLAKSTLSYWFRAIPESQRIRKNNTDISKEVWSRNISEFNRKRNLEYKKQTQKEIEKFASEVGTISKQELFYLGMGLFLAEGSKREKFSIKFTNSDPHIIKIILQFFQDWCQVETDRIHARIHIHNQKAYQDAWEYWSKISRIPKQNFWRPQFLVSKSSKGKRPENRLPYGILQITISNSSLTRKIKGWSKGIANKFMPR